MIVRRAFPANARRANMQRRGARHTGVRYPPSSRPIMTAATTPDRAMIPVALLFADLDDELAATRRVLAAYPDGHADWKPHEKSMTLSQLATHVAELPAFGAAIATKPEWVVGVDQFSREHARTREELLALFDRRCPELRAALAAQDAASLAHVWRMRAGEAVFIEGVRGPLLRRMYFGHAAHHRAQLGVYYRLLDAPVPAVYGPTADTRPPQS